jgi:integration host factor subunit beta
MKTLTFTREDIIRRTSEKLNLSYNDMKLAVDSVLETMSGMLTEEQSNIRIELRNFGVFEVKPTKAKPRARNPRTNEEVYVPPRRKVHFKPGKIIREVLQQEWIK